MTRVSIKLAHQLLAVMLLASFVSATILPPQASANVAELFDASDLVCRGTVQRITIVRDEVHEVHGQKIASRYVSVEMQPERIYKGTVPSLVIVKSLVKEPVALRSTVPLRFAKGSQRLLFLKKSGADYIYTNGQSDFATSTLVVPNTEKSGMQLLEADLKAGLRDPEHERVATNLRVLLAFPRLVSVSDVTDELSVGDPEINVLVYSILLKNRDFSRVSEMIAFVNAIPNNVPISYDTGPLLASVSQVRDESQLPLLIGFSKSTNVFFRRRTMDALRVMRSPKSVPALVERLTDTDSFVRHIAVKSLAEITGLGDPTHSPSAEEFDKSEAKYIEVWRSWWRDVGKWEYGTPD